MAAGVHGDKCITSISSADATIKGAAGYIHWITISNNHADAAAAVELQDGTTDVWGVQVEAVDKNMPPVHFAFDPPIYCATSIIIDITGGTVQATVGYT